MWFMIISIKLSQSFFGQKFSFATAKNKEKSNIKRGSKTISKSFSLYQIEKEIKITACKIDFLISQRQLFTKAIHIFAINIMTKELPPNFIF